MKQSLNAQEINPYNICWKRKRVYGVLMQHKRLEEQMSVHFFNIQTAYLLSAESKLKIKTYPYNYCRPNLSKLNYKTCFTIVPFGGVGRCLGPEGNGVSSGEGGKGGQAPQTRREIGSQLPARKEATWSRRKKERRVRCDEEDQRAESEQS